MKPTVIFALATLLFLPASAWAKRSPPEEVPQVRSAGVEYRVDHAHMGCLEAWDIATKQLLWRKQVYVVRYDVELERDVQDVFIVATAWKDGKLLIKNEHGSEYKLDPATLQVDVVKGKAVETVQH